MIFRREKRLKHSLVWHFVYRLWQVNIRGKDVFDRFDLIVAAGLGNAVSDVMGIG